MLEACLFLLAILLFFTNSTEMVDVWFHIPHILRSYIGLKLMRNLPTSREMAALLDIPKDKQLSFEEIMEYILEAANKALNKFKSSGRIWIMGYAVITLICIVLDSITFFI